MDTTHTKAWTKGERNTWFHLLEGLSITCLSYQRTYKSFTENKKMKATLSTLGNVFVPSRGSVDLLFFNHQKEAYILLKFKVDNEIIKFPQVKIALAVCQL